MWLKISVFRFDQIYQICVWIRSQDCMWEYVMCICDTMLWSIICMYFWITLRFDYIYIYICVQWFFICLENYIEYFEWNCEIKLVLCLTLFRCILSIIAYWMCGSPHQLQIFRLKFSWGTEPLDCFVRCKVERESFRRSQ